MSPLEAFFLGDEIMISLKKVAAHAKEPSNPKVELVVTVERARVKDDCMVDNSY